MSEVIELYGGPLDGTVREMPDSRAEWRFPYLPSPLPLVTDASPSAAVVVHGEAVYRVSRSRVYVYVGAS